MMKNRFLTVILIFLIVFTNISFAAGEYEFIKPRFDIVINGVKVENSNTTYPLFLYNNITYIPMTWNNSKSLGLRVTFDKENIYINSTNEGYKFVNSSNDTINQEKFYASLPKRNIFVNNVRMDNMNSKYPILIYKDILYFPLTYHYIHDVFKFEISYSNDVGLTINSLNNYYKINNEGVDSNDDNLVENNNDDKKSDDTGDVVSNVNSDSNADSENNGENEELNIINNKNVYSENPREYIENIKKYVHRLETMLILKDPIELVNGDKYYIADDFGQKVGLYKWKNGNIYVGEIDDNDNFYGVGTFYGSDLTYVGEFKNNGEEELGIYYYSDGTRSKITKFVANREKDDFILYNQKELKINSNQKVLIILTEFKDIKFKTSTDKWNKFFFGNNSVGEFYKYSSLGKVELLPAEENQGIIDDGIIKVILNENHPRNGRNLSSSNEIFLKSLEYVNEYIDFKKFDINNNGYIDSDELAIINVVAGYEYTDSNKELPSVYAHQSIVQDSRTILDDTIVNNFVIIGELRYDRYYSPSTYMQTIAVACHEMGHIFGLPDLYDTDESSQGIGIYGLMGDGTYAKMNSDSKAGEKPIDFSPWSKLKLGFVEEQIVSENGEYELYAKNTGKYNVIRVDISESEYFLIENRRFIDYDEYLGEVSKQSGILIWHIDDNVINEKYLENNVNNNEKLKGVDLEEADERRYGYSLLDKNINKNNEPFFRSDYYNNFNDNTLPSAKLNDGSESGVSIRVLENGDIAKIKIEFIKNN